MKDYDHHTIPCMCNSFAHSVRIYDWHDGTVDVVFFVHPRGIWARIKAAGRALLGLDIDEAELIVAERDWYRFLGWANKEGSNKK